MTARTSVTRRPITAWNHFRAVLLLPVMNVVVIPAAILLLARDADPTWLTRSSPAVAGPLGVLGVVLLVSGCLLAESAIALFVRRGRGTLAPWDPTQRLVTAGVYRVCRNPMKAGLFFILAAECVLLGSPALSIWAAAFMLANIVYIRVAEEPGLHARFGTPYAQYCAAVPRWLPRIATLRQIVRSRVTP